MNTLIYLALLALSIHHFVWFQEKMGFSPEAAFGLAAITHIASVTFWRLVLMKLPDMIGSIARMLLILLAASLLGFVLLILTGNKHILISMLS